MEGASFQHELIEHLDAVRLAVCNAEKRRRII
jgi:hypothetical protein